MTSQAPAPIAVMPNHAIPASGLTAHWRNTHRPTAECHNFPAVSSATAWDHDTLTGYGEAYERAQTSNAYKTNGPGRQALDKALQKIETAFGDKNWDAFEQAVQELDDLMSAVDAADQERGEREERAESDAQNAAALKERLEAEEKRREEEQKQLDTWAKAEQQELTDQMDVTKEDTTGNPSSMPLMTKGRT